MEVSGYGVNGGNPVSITDELGDRPKVDVKRRGNVVDINVKFKLYVYGRPVEEGFRFDDEFISALQSMFTPIEGLRMTDTNMREMIVNIRFSVEIEYVSGRKEAEERIKESGYGVAVEVIDRAGRSYFDPIGYEDWRKSRIVFFLKVPKSIRKRAQEAGVRVYQLQARKLAHELGHDLGFIDRFFDVPFGSSRPINTFVGTLMGTMSRFSVQEAVFMASDILFEGSLGTAQGFPVLDYVKVHQLTRKLHVDVVRYDFITQNLRAKRKRKTR